MQYLIWIPLFALALLSSVPPQPSCIATLSSAGLWYVEPRNAGNVGWSAADRAAVEITWSLDESVAPPRAVSEIRRAMQHAQTHLVGPLRESDHGMIRFRFGPSNHDCPYPFRSWELAHAWGPGMGRYSGEAHLRSDIDWSQYDLYTIALHEAGHALGMPHRVDDRAEHDGAVMWPVYRGALAGFSWSDVEEIRALYLWRGRPVGRIVW